MPQQRGKKKSASQKAAAAAAAENAAHEAAQAEQQPAEELVKVLHTGASDLNAGDLVCTEKPVISIMQKGAALQLQDVQAWVDKFAALDANTRDTILELYCHKKAASGGALAPLIGKRGEQLVEAVKIPADLPADDVWELLRIVECNTFEVAMKGGGVLSMLTLGASHLNHSCCPNAIFGLGEKGVVEVRALRKIASGEEVTISYVDEEALLRPTAERKARLYGRWQFKCACERCAAPDLQRAFRCAKVSCKGLVYPTAAGDSLTVCAACGKSHTAQQCAEFFAQEKAVTSAAPEARKELQKNAGALGFALSNRDGTAFSAASEVAMHTIGKAVKIATSNKSVDPSHHGIASLASATATVRTMLGDSFAAAGRKELAVKMWSPAAGELKEAMDAQSKALPLPRDSHVVDLVGLAALYGRLDKPEAARECFQEAQRTIQLISWACPPARREELEQMQKGVEAALAEEEPKAE